MNEPTVPTPTVPTSDPDDLVLSTVIPDGPTSDAEVEVQCPGCGLLAVGEAPRPTAAWFCPRCDYPLFWASDAPPPAGPTSRAARRRLPGASGRQVVGSSPCWHCGEMSEPGGVECIRCAATLPKPRAPHVRVPEPYPVSVPVTVRMTTWPFIAAGSLAGASVTAAVTLWLTG